MQVRNYVHQKWICQFARAVENLYKEWVWINRIKIRDAEYLEDSTVSLKVVGNKRLELAFANKRVDKHQIIVIFSKKDLMR